MFSVVSDLARYISVSPLSLLRADDDVTWIPGMLNAPREPAVESVEQAAALLGAAVAPVIVAGGGCRHFGELVVSLAEKLAVPVVTTVAGRGVIAGSHPLCAGAQLGAPAPRQLLAESDLVLVLGSELAEPDHWTAALELPEQQIWVNLDPELLASRKSALAVCADARLFLIALTKSVGRAGNQQTISTYSRVKQFRDQHGATFNASQQCHWRVWTELRKHLPVDVCIFSDMTQLAYTAIDHLPLETPNSWMHPNGYGTLGYALPAAIGAGIARRQMPVLVVVGDSGLQYTLPEIAVAVEHRLNLVVLLWHNDGLQQINDDMVEAGMTPFAVQQQNPDFVELAALYGWESSRINGLYELGSAVAAAFATDGPVLLELQESKA